MNKDEAVAQCIHHVGFVRRSVVRLLPSHDVEDVVQQVIVNFLAKADQWDYVDDIRPLLAGIAKKTVAHYWREQNRRSPDTLQQIANFLRETVQRPLSPEEHDAEMLTLKNCLSALPEQGRSLIEMYYFEGMSSERIASETRKKRGTVMRTIYRLREKLKGCIEKKIGRRLLGNGGIE